MEYKSLIDEWPVISFEPIEHLDIENRGVEIFYNSFFKLLHLPENTVRAFVDLLATNPE